MSRRAYAHALLKSQMIGIASPLGCNWPGSEHPLVERIALLKRKRPGTARRITGSGFVMAAAIFVGLGAWAAQPPVAAKFIASPYLNNPVAPAKPQIESLALVDAHPAATARLNEDYVVPKRIAAIKPSQISSIAAPILIADVDLPPAPDTPVAPASSEAPPHPPSVVAQELADLDAPVHQYPAPVLKMNASPGFDGWNNADAMKYCRDFAIQTVSQGANVPLAVDDGVKQRLNLFYWHCAFANINGTYAHSGGGMGPGYVALGQASPDHPVNVTGRWSISIPLYAQADMAGLKAMQTEPQSCNFTQVGNTISGTCTGRNDTGAATSVIDGRQVRWVWKFPQDAELDFWAWWGRTAP